MHLKPDSSHFFCVICEEDHHHAPHWGMQRRGEVHEPPICVWCVRKWGSKFAEIRRGREKTDLMRLSAIIAKLEWEIHNGRYGKHSHWYARIGAGINLDRDSDSGPSIRLRVPSPR